MTKVSLTTGPITQSITYSSLLNPVQTNLPQHSECPVYSPLASLLCFIKIPKNIQFRIIKWKECFIYIMFTQLTLWQHFVKVSLYSAYLLRLTSPNNSNCEGTVKKILTVIWRTVTPPSEKKSDWMFFCLFQQTGILVEPVYKEFFYQLWYILSGFFLIGKTVCQ